MKYPLDNLLILDAMRQATGANIHTASALIALYKNEVELYNLNPTPRCLDTVQKLEFGLRSFVKHTRLPSDAKRF